MAGVHPPTLSPRGVEATVFDGEFLPPARAYESLHGSSATPKVVVGLLSHFYPPDVGGISAIHRYTVPLFSSLGVEPLVVTRDKRRKHSRITDGPSPSNVVRTGSYGEIHRFMTEMRECGTETDPSMAIHDLKSLVARAAVAVREAFKGRGVQVINSHALADLLIGFDTADAPHVHAGHGPPLSDLEIRDYALGTPSETQIALHQYIKDALRSDRITRLIVPSQWAAQRYMELGVEPERISLIPLGVDLDFYKPNADLVPYLRRLLGIGVSRVILCPSLRKGGGASLLHALQALRARMREPITLLCTDTSELPEHLECLAVELGVRDSILCTSFPQALMPAVYSLADAVVICSLREGFCLPVLEAMACGRPVVSEASSAVAELIDSGENGLLVDVSRTRETAATLEMVLVEVELRRQLERGGLEFVQRHSHRSIAPLYASAIRTAATLR